MEPPILAHVREEEEEEKEEEEEEEEETEMNGDVPSPYLLADGATRWTRGSTMMLQYKMDCVHPFLLCLP